MHARAMFEMQQGFVAAGWRGMALAGLTPEDVRPHPPAQNSLAWLMWHGARWQDVIASSTAAVSGCRVLVHRHRASERRYAADVAAPTMVVTKSVDSPVQPNSASITVSVASWLVRDASLPIASAQQSVSSKHR